MRGIDYQPGGAAANEDPLADPKVCKRDIEHFKQLGLNTIRVYAVDNKADHDECMQALAEAGIYLVLDVNTPDFSINRIDPHPSYNTMYLQSVFATVEMFSKYDNTLAFFSGNEVINDEKNTDKSAPYIKAVTRDIKNFQNSRGLRKIPVGYSAADTPNIMQQADYFNCGSDDSRSDFFAFNDYSWCNTDFQVSGWDQKVKNYTDYGIAIFLSEFGCIKNRPRKFEEIEALMSKDMTGVYSGGLVYEYSLEDNKYGIVKLNGDDSDKVTQVKNAAGDSGDTEYEYLSKAMKNYPAPTAGNGGAASTTHAAKCPKSASSWQVDPSMVPSMPEEAQKYMKKGAGEGPGLKVKVGSQNRPDTGTSEESAASGAPSPTAEGSDSDEEDAAMSLQFSMGALCLSGLSIFFTLFGALLL